MISRARIVTAMLVATTCVIPLVGASPVHAAGRHMSLVGSLAPWEKGQYSNVAVDAARGVAYLGSFDDQGVAVIDTRDPSSPVMTDHLSTHIHDHLRTAASPDATGGDNTTAHLGDVSDSADLDLVGRYLAVSHQDLTFTDPPTGFEGISVYDTATDPYHPTLLRRIQVPGGVHTVQIDPEVENGRPYAYANSTGNLKMTVVNILTGEILSQYASSEGIGCSPRPDFCVGFNFAHEGFIQRHPRSGRVLDYISYWDSGLRIVDVTDPRAPVEVGVFDYDRFSNGLRAAHFAAPTPSGDWVYLEDEIGFLQAGGVHVLDTRACDGTAPCTPVRVGGWDLPGRDVQTAAVHRFFHHPNFNGSFLPLQNRTFIYDAHNLDRKGEDRLLIANYGMGIRLIDTSDKTAPREIAFHMTNANQDVACKMDCDHTGRQTWGSYFGSDGLIYASDLSFGFFIVDPSGRSAPGSRGSVAMVGAPGAAGRMAAGGAGLSAKLRVSRAGGGYEFSFAAGGFAVERMVIYDVTGRTVARLPVASGAVAARTGIQLVRWNGRSDTGSPLARGVYFVRAEGGGVVAGTKLVHWGE